MPRKRYLNRGFSGWYLKSDSEIHFRSLNELSYMIELDSRGDKWESAEHIGIKYKLNGRTRTYRPDFLINSVTLAEVKPASLIDKQVNVAKAEAAKQYCAENGLAYQIVSPTKLTKSQLKNLLDSGSIRIVDHLKRKFSKYISSK